jgi:uncharacterized membrane protein YphA (DoxX/SURF4 family)
MRALVARFHAMFDEPRSVRALALLRIATGAIVVLHFRHEASALVDGRFYADSFHSPWLAFMPEPPRELYAVLLFACIGAAVCLAIGLFTRVAAICTALFFTWHFFLDQTTFHNHRALLLLVLATLALVPCGRVLSIDALIRRRDENAPLWPMYLLRAEVLAMYLGSGGSKLFDSDWRDGIVTWDRVLRFRGRMEASVLPTSVIDLLCKHEFHYAFAKVAIATELFIAVGLVVAPLRYAAAFTAFWFHLVIGVSLDVDIYSHLAVSALLVWAIPKTRGRRLEIRIDRRLGRWFRVFVRAFDWLARFEIEPALERGAPIVTLVERDGAKREGAEAALFTLLRLPLFFPFVAPLAFPGRRRLAHRLFAPFDAVPPPA